MADDGDTTNAAPEPESSDIFETLKLDFKTVKTVVLTAGVVVVLLAAPLFFVLRNFVTFDALDRYFKLTDSVRPRILNNVAEELHSGYSKNFAITQSSTDNTLLFYALSHQRVTLSLSAQAIGPFPQLSLYLNNCVFLSRAEPFQLYERDLSKEIESCPPDEPDLHTLRIALSGVPPKGTVLQVNALVLVSQRIHEHMQDEGKK